MLSSQAIGVVADLHARRDSALARITDPRARARILGVPYTLPAAKEHRITVNLKTGERTVETVEEPTAQKRNPFRIVAPPAPPKRMLVAPKHSVNVRQLIIQCVEDAFGLKRDELYIPCRAHRVSHPRFAAMALMRTILGYSTTQLGRPFKMDHTSAMHALSRVPVLAVSSRGFAARMRAARAAIKKGIAP